MTKEYLVFFCIIFPLNKHEYSVLNKIDAVKKKWKEQNIVNYLYTLYSAFTETGATQTMKTNQKA